MGLHDRAYYRDSTSAGWYELGAGRVCRWLVLINVGVYVLQLATLNFRTGDLGGFTRFFIMDPELVFHHGEVWRLFSALFLHDPTSFWHIVFNMLMLWMMGPDVEDLLRPREFLVFYLVAGLCSTALWGVWALQGGRPDQAFGASGAVLGVLTLAACYFPRREVRLLGIFPMPLWLLVTLFVAYDSWQFALGTQTKVAVVGHLAGAGFAGLYFWRGWRLTDWQRSWRLPVWRWPWRRTNLRLYRPDGAEPRHAAEEPRLARLRERLDAVLAKLQHTPREQLSPEDQQVLLEASEAFRQRRR